MASSETREKDAERSLVDDGANAPFAAFDAVAKLARVSEVAQVARKVLFEAAERRRTHYADAAKVAEIAEELGLSHADCETPFGNALGVLEAGAEDDAERVLVGALVAHALSEAPPKTPEAENAVVADLLWLATHARADALPLVDRALGDGAGDLWTAVAEAVRRIDAGKGGVLGRSEAIVGVLALAASESPGALVARKRLAPKDPVLARLLSGSDEGHDGDARRIEGELTYVPRGAFATAFLAFTGLLFAVSVLRIFGAIALSYKRPAEVFVTKTGVRVKSKTVLLGRTLREDEVQIARPSLVRASREIRYPRAGLYAGLFALAVGSYLGLSLFVDGIRSASPSLLLTGLLFVAAGIGLDFVLGSALSSARGRCRIAFVPTLGKNVCVADVDPKSADRALALLRG
jgi:hypothetical protein